MKHNLLYVSCLCCIMKQICEIIWPFAMVSRHKNLLGITVHDEYWTDIHHNVCGEC